MIRAAMLALLALSAAPARATTFTVAVTTSGPVTSSTVVTSAPNGISCPPTCSHAFTADSTVTLTNVAPSTIAFLGWGAPCRSGSPTCTVTVDDNLTITAGFAPTLSLTIFGTGIGTVTAPGQPPCETGCTRSFIYPTGTEIVLTESTGAYSAFTGWSGSGGCDRASTCTITLNTYTAIIATFTASSATYPLTVKIPKGGGTVTSSPAGISCPGTCSATFTANAAVTLTTAAATGYRFAGWANGGCSGINLCVVTSTSPLQGLGNRYSPAAYFYPE